MVRLADADIPALGDHPELEILREYDHPAESLRRWHGTLTARAWMGPELACFFVGSEVAERYVLFFHASKGYSPRFSGGDMRKVSIGTAFELDVFVASRTHPIVDVAIPIKVFG